MDVKGEVLAEIIESHYLIVTLNSSGVLKHTENLVLSHKIK